MLTLKSDNPHEKRVELKNVFASKTMPVSYIPEFLRVFLIYLCGLGIDMQLFDSANNSIDILSRDTKCLPLNFEPEMIQNATLSVANLYDKEKCEGWSCGEVSNLIIGYDTEGYKDDGLFSQVIFGPIKDNKCKCRFRSKKAIDNQKCPNCKVVIGSSKMRNYRMGYIELPQPIVNPLFIIQVAKLLLIPEASLKKLLFNKKYLLSDLNLLSDLIISFKGNKNTQRFLELLRGIGIVYENPMEIAEEILKRKIKEIVINDRFMVMEKLLIYKECTKYLIKYLPVIPPVYRPYTVISGGTQLRICGDINSHYLDILAFCNKKNREKIDSVGIQKSVAQLFDKKIWQPKMNSSGEHRETLLSKIIGNDTAKEGFFRKYMLGKRVDYSGRAVIVPGVNLGMDECLLPIEMVIEIYRPLFEKSFSKKEIKKIEKYRTAISPEMIYKMNKVISKYPVLINRQPTLHNLNIQAFYPKITMDSVIHFQPLVTSGFNADYDGDTVAVHVPVSRDACDESKQMLASNNIISKADGSITVNVSQDIALGIYKYTGILAGRKNFEQQLFGDVNNRITEPVGKKILYKLLSDSYKLLYEKNRGQVIPGQDEQALEKTRGEFKKIVEWIKDTGFNYATKSGFSLGIEDFVGKDNSPSIDMLLKSSARSDETTLNQITDKRGAMQRIGTSGKFSVQKTTEIEASLLGGMNLGEIFISCYGSRKTLVDKKVGVADCGYITRQMVELLCDVKLNRQICTSEQTINHPKFELISIKSDDSNGIFNDKDIEIIKQTKLFERNWKYNWWGSKEWDDFIGKLPKDQYIILENEFKSPPIGFLIGRYKPKQKKYSLKYVLANINLRKFKINSGNEIRDEQGKLLINLASGESLIGIEFLRDYWSPIEMSKMRFEKLKYIVKGDKDKQRVKQAIEKIRAYIAVQVLSPMTQYISKNIITCDSSDGGCVDCYHRFGEEIPANIDQIAAGIIAAQSLGEPLTQNVMRTFHTGGAASEEEAVIEKINQVLECRHPSMLKLLWALKSNNPNEIIESQFGVVDTLYDLYKELRSGKEIDIRHIELLVRQMVRRYQSQSAITLKKSALNSPDWLAKISFEEMRKNLPEFAANNKIDNLTGLKQRVIFGKVK